MLKSFDIRKDRQAIAEGGFFCLACLLGKPSNDESPDSRYCKECFLVLEAEAAMVKKQKAKWVPGSLTGIVRESPVVQNGGVLG